MQPPLHTYYVCSVYSVYSVENPFSLNSSCNTLIIHSQELSSEFALWISNITFTQHSYVFLLYSHIFLPIIRMVLTAFVKLTEVLPAVSMSWGTFPPWPENLGLNIKHTWVGRFVILKLVLLNICVESSATTNWETVYIPEDLNLLQVWGINYTYSIEHNTCFFWFRLCLHMCDMFWPVLRPPQACQYKILIKEDIIKSEGLLAYSQYFK